MDPEPQPQPAGDAAWRFAGHWFTALGVSSLLAMPLAWAQGRGVVDLSFILTFSLASSLFRRSAAGRRWAIGLCATFLGFAALCVVLSVLGYGKGMNVLGARNPAPDLVVTAFGAFAVILLPPIVPLLSADARALAGTPPAPRPSRSYALLYVMVVSLLASGSVSFSKLIRRESITQGGTIIAGANGRSAWTAELWCGDGSAPGAVRLIGWVVVFEKPYSASLSLDAGSLRVHGHDIPFSPERSWIMVPPTRVDARPLLIDGQGAAERLPCRVTGASMNAALAAAAGFTDLEDLKRRLLGALPPN